MTRRFYAGPGVVDGDRVRIDGALARRLATVLRLRAGAEITLFDGSGEDARVRLREVSAGHAAGEVVGRCAGTPEPRLAVHLYQSIAKGERFEWLVEKATEIGVARIVPLIAARAVVRTPGDAKRVERWRRIAVEAAEQCGRSRVPGVGKPQRFADVVREPPGLRLLPYESAGDRSPSVAAAMHEAGDGRDVSIFIGPEGGWEAAEVEMATAAGAVVVTLGRRVLRAETAGLVASALVLAAAGELG